MTANKLVGFTQGVGTIEATFGFTTVDMTELAARLHQVADALGKPDAHRAVFNVPGLINVCIEHHIASEPLIRGPLTLLPDDEDEDRPCVYSASSCVSPANADEDDAWQEEDEEYWRGEAEDEDESQGEEQ